MKKVLFTVISAALLSCTDAPAQTKKFEEKIRKEFDASSAPILAIYNINGSIRVEGYDGDKIVVEIEKQITSGNEHDLEKGKQEFRVVTEQKGDSVISYIAAPFDSRPRQKNIHTDKLNYKFQMEYVVKVPNRSGLHVSTVNGGNVDVRDVAGHLEVSNVNGSIKVTNAKSLAKIHTVNGTVDASFLTIPAGEYSFKTINGDINIVAPKTLSADCDYKSMHGEFYTDFDDAESIPAKITKSDGRDRGKTVYKIDSKSAYRIGNGEQQKIHFETINGSVYVKKQS